MKRRFVITYSEIVRYTPVEITAESEDEAKELLQERVQRNDVEIDDTEEYDLEIEDLGEDEL